MEVFWVVVVVGVGIAIFFGIQKAKELEAAKQAHLQSIAELKQAPTNASQATYVGAGTCLLQPNSRQEGEHRF